MTSDIERISDFAVAISSEEGAQAVGSGFLIRDRLVATCAHVVQSALNVSGDGDVADRPIWVRLLFGVNHDWMEARVEAGSWWPLKPDSTDPNQDVAILRLVRDDFEFAPHAPLNPRVTMDEEVLVYGIPDRVTGIYATGKPVGAVSGGRFEIHPMDAATRFIEKGYSGSAVWSKQNHSIIGLMARADEGRRKAHFISIGQVASFCSEIASITGDENYLQYLTSRFSGAFTASGVDSGILSKSISNSESRQYIDLAKEGALISGPDKAQEQERLSKRLQGISEQISSIECHIKTNQAELQHLWNIVNGVPRVPQEPQEPLIPREPDHPGLLAEDWKKQDYERRKSNWRVERQCMLEQFEEAKFEYERALADRKHKQTLARDARSDVPGIKSEIYGAERDIQNLKNEYEQAVSDGQARIAFANLDDTCNVIDSFIVRTGSSSNKDDQNCIDFFAGVSLITLIQRSTYKPRESEARKRLKESREQLFEEVDQLSRKRIASIIRFFWQFLSNANQLASDTTREAADIRRSASELDASEFQSTLEEVRGLISGTDAHALPTINCKNADKLEEYAQRMLERADELSVALDACTAAHSSSADTATRASDAYELFSSRIEVFSKNDSAVDHVTKELGFVSSLLDLYEPLSRSGSFVDCAVDTLGRSIGGRIEGGLASLLKTLRGSQITREEELKILEATLSTQIDKARSELDELVERIRDACTEQASAIEEIEADLKFVTEQSKSLFWGVRKLWTKLPSRRQ